MNNLWSYCGLTDSRRSISDTDLTVTKILKRTAVMSYDVQNPEKLLIVLSSDIYIENISFYALNTSKLKFGCYLTFEFTFLALSYSLVPVFCYCFTSKNTAFGILYAINDFPFKQ